MLDKKLIAKEFAHLQDVIFLNATSVVIPPKSVQAAYHGFMDEYVDHFGEGVVDRAWGIVGESRREVARLIGAKPTEIGFVKNTSEGIGIIANGFPFEQGDNVVTVDQEHSSNLFAWIKLQEKGVKLRIVASRDGEIRLKDIFSNVTSRTRAISLSAVQFTTGFYTDLATLGSFCERHGILLIVDGIQAVGHLHIDVKAMKINYLACGGNKGLLATLGAGFVFCDEDLVEQIIPPYASYQSVSNQVHPPAITQDFDGLAWHQDARRFESGNLNYAGIAAIGAGAALLNHLGIENIQQQVLKLDEYLTKGLEALPVDLRTPSQKKNHSGVLCVYYPSEQEQQVIAILKERKIFATMRGGYIRLGINFYNTKNQMDTVIKAFEEIGNLK
ncbi:MAG: aminotransferase class V-fold PLP-dependent enzyme [Negativicutes bacterium]